MNYPECESVCPAYKRLQAAGHTFKLIFAICLLCLLLGSPPPTPQKEKQ